MKLRFVTGNALIACAGLASLVAGVFMSSAQAQSSVINACVNRSSGEIKVVPEGASCHGGSVLVQWNPVGSPGQPGAMNVQYVLGGMYPGTSVARAFCPTGTKVVGGGGLSISGAGLQQSFPIADSGGLIAWGSTAVGWQVAASDWSPVQAHVVCAGP